MNSYINKNSSFLSKYGEFSSGYFEDRKSKFYCYLFSINDVEEANSYINKVKNNNKDARHVIYIYSYIENDSPRIRFSDDGEPQGTGTRAIYDVLVRENITNICIVIVRYFGGILLGAGPLSRAYLNSFRNSISECDINTLLVYKEYTFYANYNNIDRLKSILNKYEHEKLVIIDDIIYDIDITIKVRLEINQIDKILPILKEITK